MASINYAAREISVKIVYYGPGLSGKTTNLQIIHRKVPQEYKSDMVSLATETDRTLFFDFLPLNLGKIKGFTAKFQLYTVPGQVYYSVTRKLVLRGVDGVVFVADSAQDKIAENLESFQNLEENLAEYGYKREEIPMVMQYNKRDLPNAMSVADLNAQINKYNLPTVESIATKGDGIFETLKMIGKIVIDELNRKYARQSGRSAAAARPAAPAPQRPSAPAPQASPPPPPAPQQQQPAQSSTPPPPQPAYTPPPQQTYNPVPQPPHTAQSSTPPPAQPAAPTAGAGKSELDLEIERYQQQMTGGAGTGQSTGFQAGMGSLYQQQSYTPPPPHQSQQSYTPPQPSDSPSFEVGHGGGGATSGYQQPQSIEQQGQNPNAAYGQQYQQPPQPQQQQYGYPSPQPQGQSYSSSFERGRGRDEFDDELKPKKGFFAKLFGKR